MTDLTKLIELQAAATQGPWSSERAVDMDGYETGELWVIMKGLPRAYNFDNSNDSEFTAAARNFDFAALDAKIKRYEDALDFIAIGCLVPPDGGSPCLNDAMEAARKALEGIE